LNKNLIINDAKVKALHIKNLYKSLFFAGNVSEIHSNAEKSLFALAFLQIEAFFALAFLHYKK
jgi:hypothetical protein